MATSIISQLLELDSQEFESTIVRLLLVMGFEVEATRQTGDGGIDAIAYLETPVVGGKYIVQCKRYAANKVSVSAIRDLYGVIMDERAMKGILFTTSSFTKDAQKFAGGKNLELVDGETLAALLVENEIMLTDSFPTTSEPLAGGHLDLIEDDELPEDYTLAIKMCQVVGDELHSQEMVDQIGWFRTNDNKIQPFFRIRESFGKTSNKNTDENDESSPSEDEIAQMRQLALEWPNDAKTVEEWIRHEEDSSLVLNFHNQHGLPNSASAYANMAVCHCICLELYDVVMMFAGQAIELLTKDGADDQFVSDFLYNVALILGITKGRIPLSVFREGLDYCPNNPYIRLEYAEVLTGSDVGTVQNNEMLTQVNEAARLASRNSKVLSRIAQLLCRNGHAEHSREFAMNALQLAESSDERTSAHIAIGMTLVNTGDYVQAIHHFESALELDDNDLDAKTGLAAALFNTGVMERSVKLARECLAEDPENRICLNIISSIEDDDLLC